MILESIARTKVLERIVQSFEERGIGILGTHIVASKILIFVDCTEKNAALSSIKEIYEAL